MAHSFHHYSICLYQTIDTIRMKFSTGACDQYHFGSDGSNYVQTFNYQNGQGTGKHLANQHQTICVR